MGATVSLGCSTFFTVSSLILVALAFSTDYWVDLTLRAGGPKPPTFMVDPNEERLYYSRHFGLFRECFDNRTFLIGNSYFRNQVIDGNCLRIEYEIPEKPSHKLYSDQYWSMIHLSRCIVAFFIVAMLFLLTGAIFGSVSCWASSHKSARVAGAFVFAAAVSAALSMAFFHGVDHIKKEKLETGDSVLYYRLWPADVKAATIRRYSWSYIVGWVSVGVALFAAILYLFTAWYIRDRKREQEIYETAKTRRYYDMVDTPVYTTVAAPPLQQTGPEYVYILNGKPVYASMPRYAYNGPYDYDEQSIKVAPEPWEYRY